MFDLQTFFLINTLVWTGGLLQFSTTTDLFLSFLTTLFKNVSLLSFIHFKNRNKEYFKEGERHLQGWKEVGYLFQVSFIDFLSLHLLLTSSTTPLTWELLTFIPRSFLFEVCFDLAHYTIHRLCHSIPTLYITIHKEHHQNTLIHPLTTFHQHPLDLLLTNTLPLSFAACIIPHSSFFLCLMMWYKTLIEIGGHLGKFTKATSFPQCILLPKLFHIDLKTEDHHEHHLNPMQNFSKRFALWDKVFGTYSNTSIKTEKEKEKE